MNFIYSTFLHSFNIANSFSYFPPPVTSDIQTVHIIVSIATAGRHPVDTGQNSGLRDGATLVKQVTRHLSPGMISPHLGGETGFVPRGGHTKTEDLSSAEHSAVYRDDVTNIFSSYIWCL